MNDNRPRANLVKKRNISGKRGDIFCRAHGVATELHDNRLLGIAAHEGQRLDKHAGLLDQL